MRKKLIPKAHLGLGLNMAQFGALLTIQNMPLSRLLTPEQQLMMAPGQAISPLQTLGFIQNTINPSLAPGSQLSFNASPAVGKANLFSNNHSIAQGVNNFSNSGMGGLAASGIELLSTNLGLKPQYLMNNNGERAMAGLEGISKNFGNPLVNAAGDAVAGGIGKLMGLNTDKVVGGGMAGVNAVSNVLSNFGPIGMAAGVVLKGANMLGGKNLEDFDTNARVQQSSGYTGSASKIQETSDKYGGAMVSGVDRIFGTDKRYQKRIQELKLILNRIKGILNTSDENLAAQTGSADMFRMRNSMNMLDNSYLYNGVLAARKGGRLQLIINMLKGGSFDEFRKTLPKPLQDTVYYRLLTLWEHNGKPKDFEVAKKLNLFEEVDGEYHAPSVVKNKDADEYLFLKVPSHRTVTKELDWYDSDDAKDFREQYDLDKSGDVWKYVPKKSKKFADGGKMNVIPEGALHAHKHKLQLENTTKKGIPVISQENGGEITQHAEIERNEIVFTKEASERLEDLWKQYNSEGLTKKERDAIAIQAGELLTFEIIENTDDRTGLLTQV